MKDFLLFEVDKCCDVTWFLFFWFRGFQTINSKLVFFGSAIFLTIGSLYYYHDTVEGFAPWYRFHLFCSVRLFVRQNLFQSLVKFLCPWRLSVQQFYWYYFFVWSHFTYSVKQESVLLFFMDDSSNKR